MTSAPLTPEERRVVGQVEWLKGHKHDCTDYTHCIRCGAAQTITAQARKLERYEAALRDIAEHKPLFSYVMAGEDGGIDWHSPGSPYDRGMQKGCENLSATARTALENTE